MPSARRQYRATSPDSLRQLYGVPVSQIRTSEDAFRKEAYKRDKQRLRRVVEAINAEKKQVERRWDARKSQFAQQRALHAPPRKRREVVYHKVATLEAQPEELVPPCIPFVGHFPPFRHPTKPRRVGEMFKEPLFTRRVLHTHSAGCAREKKRGEEAGRWKGTLTDERGSLLPSAASFATSSRPAQRGDACPSSVQQGQFRNAKSADTTTNRDIYQSYPSGSVDTFGKQASATSLRMTRGCTDQKVSNNQTTDSQLQVMDDGYYTGRSIDYELNNNWLKPVTDCIHSQVPYNKSSQLSTSDKTQLSEESLANENNTRLKIESTKTASPQKTVSSVLESQRLVRVVEQVVATDRAKEAQQLTTDHIQAVAGREGEENLDREDPCSRRSDLASTPDSMDIDLLQQALVDHAAQNLNKNRWQRVTEHVKIPTHSGPGDDTPLLPPLLHSKDSFQGSALSLPSVSTPTTRSATDASEVAADSGMAVVRIIMQLFRELDQPQLSNLADLWPRKMEKMMSAIEDLVRDTGVDITEIVEKIQRGDVQDDKSAALLDWISSIDTAVPAGLQGESDFADNQHVSNTRVSFSVNNRVRRSQVVEDVNGNTLLDGHGRVGSRRPSAFLTKGPAGKGAGGQETAQSGVGPSGHQHAVLNAGREHSHLGTTVCQLGHTTADTSLSSRTRTVEHRRKSRSASSTCIAPCVTTETATVCQMRRASIFRRHSAVMASQSKPVGTPSSCSNTSKNEDATLTKLPAFTASSLSHPASGLSNINRLIQRDSAEKKNGDHLLPCVYQSHPLVFVTEDSHPASTSPDNSPTVAVSLTPLSKTARSSSQVRVKLAGENGSPQNSHQIKQVRSVNASTVDTVSRPCGGEKDLRKTTEQQGNDRRRFRASSLLRIPVSTDDPVSPAHSAKCRASSTGRDTAHFSTEDRPRARQSAAIPRRKYADHRGMETAHGENQSVSPSSHSVQENADNIVAWPEEQEQTTETLLHKDRRGRMHCLTMRKVSLSDTCAREANVTFTRDDSTFETAPLCNANGNREDISASLAAKEERRFSGTQETKQYEQQPESSSPAADRMKAALPDPEVSHNDEQDEDETKDLGEKHNEDRVDGEVEEEDYEGLWRRRLAHSSHMSWVQELTTDHRAQGLALSLLLRKQGGGPKFLSVALKVICINALRAAKHVHEDQAYRNLKNCRYLRMPEDYLPDIQRELDLHEIFA